VSVRDPVSRGSRTRRWLVAFVALVVAATLLAPLLRDAILSGLLAVELLRPLRPGPVTWVTRSPQEMRIAFPGRQRTIEANLYVPAGGGKRAGVVLVHGVVETGKDDPRMLWAARLLARSGFVVLVPDFLGFKSLRLRTSDIGEMTDAVLYLRSLHNQILPDRIGIIGFSYGAGPMLVAAGDPLIAHHLRFVVSFGGYHDLVQVIKFVTTGHYRHRDERGYSQPSDSNRWIFLRYNLDLLQNPVDRAILSKVSEDRGWGRTPRQSPDPPTGLTSEGQSVYRLLVNRDPERVEHLVRQLAPPIQQMINQLSPSRQLTRLAAHTIIVHSDPDPFIPHTESLALAEALGQKGKVRLEILRLFRHVQPELPDPTFETIVKVYLPEGWKVYRLIFDLLRQQR
jgi:acetyl esterase/lipase